MPKARDTARIHLIAAKEAPIVVIIRRKPSEFFHIIRWNLTNDSLEHGSWFKGQLYPLKCDLSWDGELMSYLARGHFNATWNGVCRIPWLKTLLESENVGSYNGSGIFWEKNLLLMNEFMPSPITYHPGWPSKMKVGKLPTDRREDLVFLFYRLARDGWKLKVQDWEIDFFDKSGAPLVEFNTLFENPFVSQPTKEHPELSARYVGQPGNAPVYAGRTGDVFHFELTEHPDLLGPQVDWATWSNVGDLIWSEGGVIFRQSLKGFESGQAPKSFELNSLERPKPTNPNLKTLA